ncbi:uncharacterized protein H6S33_003508 [Morchella sextelata]|uniref:uncharacterized protein n=1 Tax=Morchella sextelata TaxID=1174677 RepID=UPI001D0371FE|nr:uncharacterized protein H6S33_003508 [Morchella sextelata]KAH0606674.1 hypothetical protein H6S33_003508 [Morchella sextelata]
MQFPTFAILALAATLVQAAPQVSYAGTLDAMKCMSMDKQFDSHMRSTEAELPAGIDKCHAFSEYAKACEVGDVACYTTAWTAFNGGYQS